MTAKDLKKSLELVNISSSRLYHMENVTQTRYPRDEKRCCVLEVCRRPPRRSRTTAGKRYG